MLLSVEAYDGQLLPEIVLHIPLIHKEYIVVSRRLAQLDTRRKILAELYGEHFFQHHHRQELRFRLTSIHAYHTEHGLRTMLSGLPRL